MSSSLKSMVPLAPSDRSEHVPVLAGEPADLLADVAAVDGELLARHVATLVEPRGARVGDAHRRPRAGLHAAFRVARADDELVGTCGRDHHRWAVLPRRVAVFGI